MLSCCLIGSLTISLVGWSQRHRLYFHPKPLDDPVKNELSVKINNQVINGIWYIEYY